MDDLLVAYENQTTRSLWKIIQNVTQKLIAFALESVQTLRLCLEKNLVFGLMVALHLFFPSVALQSQH